MQDRVPRSQGPGNGSPALSTVDAVSGLGGPADSQLPRPLVTGTLQSSSQTDDNAVEDVLAESASDTSPEAFADNGSSIYGGEDDAQSFIQPAISPMASRLSSPRTPALEKAMAMDHAVNSSSGGGFFDAYKPPISSRLQNSTPVPSHIPSQAPAAPARVAQLPKPSAMSSVFQSSTRHGRSSSVGSDALKRLSKVLPSISFPSASSFLSNRSPTSFFSSNSGNGTGFFSQAPSSPPATSKKASPRNSPTRTSHPTTHASQQQPQPQPQPQPRSNAAPSPDPHTSRQSPGRVPPRTAHAATFSEATFRAPLHRPPSVVSRRSYALRRSTSDDSLLYHTLSRVPSHGDEGEFVHIHEQVNSRVKAIMDSFDRPTFKMPQLPTYREPLSPLDAALESLTGDVVILGGYRGSILRSAEPPHRQLWVPVKVGLNIRKVNMEVGLNDEDEENMPQHIFPSGMLKHIGPVDISRRLFKKMRECENARKGLLRVHDYGYDWRLSPHRLSKQLIDFLEKLPSNQQNPPGGNRGAVVISHSLGGLITRHAVNQRPELFAGVIFAGTPQRCINILGPLRNGDAVLLNEKVLTAQVHFSLRTTFAFLPEDGFCFINNKNPNEEYRVNFYDVDEWIKHRISPCAAPPALPASGSDNWGSGEFPPKRSSTASFGRTFLEDLSGSLPSLPLRNRLNSAGLPPAFSANPEATAATRQAEDNTTSTAGRASPLQPASPSMPSSPISQSGKNGEGLPAQAMDPEKARYLEYLERTLANTRIFRAELAHRPEHSAANVYPPLAVIYGKGIPTVYAARVSSREAIATTAAYDDLVFRTGDGVVLSREALLPPGYHYVRDGYVCTDRGHVGMLGDLNAVGHALGALIRGRQKGIGLGAAAASDLPATKLQAAAPVAPQVAVGSASDLLSAAMPVPPASSPLIHATT
ncbi:hypothetical protein F503_05051 [Ophiostoma piceae UAMH 11346]|uniref:Uncharacterized protein n=1 Tax=Ophiostoma piceae (strain UAMH 11346) TaxID=1262450 RepID=S3CD62_OPHP1|nr:hypothetical protein F503_05051 [Ophiostoma piceae UAMH 11346]